VATRRSRTRGRSKATREFVSEAEDILERTRADLVDLDEAQAAGCEVEPDLVNRLFRSAHSLKGLAGMFGLDAVSELAHRLEDLLDALRLGRASVGTHEVALLHEGVAVLGQLFESLDDSGLDAASAQAARGLAARIAAAGSRAGASADADLSELELDPALLRALTEYEEHRLRENVRRGRKILVVHASFELMAFDAGLRELTEALRCEGEVLSTLPAPGESPESEIRFSLLFACDLEAAALAARLRIDPARVTTAWAGAPAAEARQTHPEAEEIPAEAPAVASAAPAHDEGDGAGSAGAGESLQSFSDTVRVDIHKLDELMNLVGELAIQRGAVGEIASRLLAEPGTARAGAELAKVHKALERKLRELQAGVLEVRMVPLRQVFEKLSRVVRRLRRETGKNVHLDLRGADTELDKLIVEELIDPLMHIVRNAIDHAIESPAERAAAGKPPEGSIRIAGAQRGSHVVIEVSDDGRGIDEARVRAAAEARGLIEPGQTLTRAETLSLLFAPGLSTADRVSETSGRGVGLDVVKANLTALGGMVDVASLPGQGATFTLTLPITLAIIQALVVGVGAQRYAVPLTSVFETLVLEPGQLQRSEGREILNLRGAPLPLRRLREEFGLGREGEAARPYVVVIGLGGSRVGLLVDRLEGQQDALIKSIQGPVQGIRGVAGATELGDGAPVLVLDVAAFSDESVRRREAA
jgi:two-component system chemotaxis sensor kinase CheA